MIRWGAPVAPNERSALVEFLAAAFGGPAQVGRDRRRGLPDPNLLAVEEGQHRHRHRAWRHCGGQRGDERTCCGDLCRDPVRTAQLPHDERRNRHGREQECRRNDPFDERRYA